MLYQAETNGDDPELALGKYCESFPYQVDVFDYARLLLAGVKNEKARIDGFLEEACDNWKVSRLTYVDRGVLRLGVYEMCFSPDVPPKVAIDEAIELGKKYGSEDSREFINGVLDKIFHGYYQEKEKCSNDSR
jgi:transcription antitermination protein NusB